MLAQSTRSLWSCVVLGCVYCSATGSQMQGERNQSCGEDLNHRQLMLPLAGSPIAIVGGHPDFIRV